MTELLRIPPRAVARIAQGPADRDILHFLADVTLNKHLLLLVNVGRHTDKRDAARDALHVLDEARRHDPTACADLLSNPWVGAWGVAAAAHLRGNTEPSHAHKAYLAGLAAVAAVQTRQSVKLTTQVLAGHVWLPTLGVARIDAADGTPAMVRVNAESVTVEAAGLTVEISLREPHDAADWSPTRVLTAEADGKVLRVVLEDQDPHRSCYKMPVATRVDRAEVGDWQTQLQDAWKLLVRHAPGYADELATGLRALVPLPAEHTAPGLSATSRVAYGALALTLPRRPAHLAVTLVHEYQHSKLSALLDALPLYDTDPDDRFFAPWRRDARPLGGLLQGAYAFTAVSELWHLLRAEDAERDEAERHFAELREQVDNVLVTLDGSGQLNTHGRRLVAGMRRRLQRLLDEPLPEPLVQAARDLLATNRAEWEVRHTEVVRSWSEPLSR